MRSRLPLRRLIGIGLFFFAMQLSATEIWNSAAFSVDAAALRLAADAVKADRHSEATVLLNDQRFTLDASGRMVETRHLIYRVETQEGVENWAESSGYWKAWYQSKPEIRARVITAEGTEHWLDAKTLNDVAARESDPEVYSDERKFGGPLPAVAVGAIVEEEVVTRDTAPMFAAGQVHRLNAGWSVPVNRTRYVISHPESLALCYQLQMMPEAVVAKFTRDGVETITIEQGRLAGFTERSESVPSDVVLYPELEFSTAESWQKVAAAYAALSEDKLRPSEAAGLLGKINLKDANRNGKIRRIVAALHKNVRYTGIEFGESSLIPQVPSETLKRKYGDCKDKASLLVAMLRGAGIAANLALLDTGPGQDVNPGLPGMGMFDHAIVYVPAIGTEPELWVDATAQYSQVGTLPWMDYGRQALVISENTAQLKKIPELTADKNVQREVREFVMAEFGMATITETSDQLGPHEADFREYYSGDSKQVKENSESYVKSAYAAESLISLEHGELADLDKPGSIKMVTKGRRGSTDLTSAVMAIWSVDSLFGGLPKYFKTKEEPKKAEGDDAEKPKERTADWAITPFTYEWHYRIVAPPGFKLRALPSDKNEKVNVISFTQKYSANAEGTMVEAVLRAENTTSRLTAEQGRALRDAVLKLAGADSILITFDHVGHALIAAGKIREGLAAYRELVTLHPKEALHKIQLSDALLTAGLGEEARTVAQEAVKLEPDSAQAYSNLGRVLKYDLIGRLEKKGMDYPGAVAAYRKSLVLDPKDKLTRVNLALLLEYDADGVRYGEKAPLKEAVSQLRELQRQDEEYFRGYEDNVLYDLWYANDYKGVLEYVATLPASEGRNGLMLGAIALTDGTDAALKRSLQMTTDDAARVKALTNATAVLIRVRKYAEAGALMSEGAKGQSNESELSQNAARFSKTQRYENLKFDAGDPASVVRRLYGAMLSGKLTYAEFNELTTGTLENSDVAAEKQFQQMMTKLTVALGGSLPLTTIADIAASNMHFSVDGDEVLGYKVIVESPGAKPQTVYVVREGARCKVLAFSMAGSPQMDHMGTLALEALEQHKPEAARKWLDRAREAVHQGGGDDPLGGPNFPHFWTKGQPADDSAMRTAAIVLLSSRDVKSPHIQWLMAARQSAKSDAERNQLAMTMVYAYWQQERWLEMLPLAEELAKAEPTSLRAFQFVVAACTGLKRYDACEALIQARIKEHPDELDYVRMLATLAGRRGQFEKSREIVKAIIDKGEGTANDMNLYGWHALPLAGPISQETIDITVKANERAKNNWAVMHTLACVYAAAGKPNQARSLLLKVMELQGDEEPGSSVWFGLAMIAEQYGVMDAAEKMYARVEKPKNEDPADTWAYAQQRLSAVRALAKSTTKPAGQ